MKTERLSTPRSSAAADRPARPSSAAPRRRAQARVREQESAEHQRNIQHLHLRQRDGKTVDDEERHGCFQKWRQPDGARFGREPRDLHQNDHHSKSADNDRMRLRAAERLEDVTAMSVAAIPV